MKLEALPYRRQRERLRERSRWGGTSEPIFPGRAYSLKTTSYLCRRRELDWRVGRLKAGEDANANANDIVLVGPPTLSSCFSSTIEPGKKQLHTPTTNVYRLVIFHPRLKVKQDPELPHRIVGTLHRMPNRPRVLVDLVVVPTLVRLVTKEVDLLEVLCRDVRERVRLVPPVRAARGC